MSRFGRLVALATIACSASLSLFACGEPPEKPKHPKAKECPPPPEPDHQAVVVGTIGKLHLVESRYALPRLGDVLTAFKPDLVLVGVRPDAFHEGHLEEGSFEMTYVSHLAKARGIAVEPIDWYREAELGAAPPAVDPFDATEIAKRETDALSQPRLYTFEQANGQELAERIFLATGARARYYGGAPLASRRSAWIAELATNAVARHQRPRRVLAFVDVLDRPAVANALSAFAYAPKSPVEVAQQAKEVIVADVPNEVVDDWRSQIGRARKRAEGASGAEKALWADRERVLEVAVEKRGACCVTQSALSPTSTR